ncbi:MAG TPA: response regulator [Candidatus Paenibacillus intestinavium]|nr:response regulator [Candidatus Paenibacillus intestinavium]
MYKVLLVDDEILDLKGMQTFIPWAELGMEIAATATSGFAASEVIAREKVDILVTDVRMPNMSGLELARKALDKYEKLRIIFVSGYQDFNYIKQALSLNACSYVLKPMDDNELIESLKKLRLELDEEKKLVEAEQLYKSMIPIVKNESLFQLLEGSLDARTLGVLIQEYKLNALNWPVQVVIVERDDWIVKRSQEIAIDESELSKIFWDILFAMCAENQIEHMCKVTDKRLALLIDSTMDLNNIHNVFERDKLKLPLTVTIGIGDIVANAYELKDSYQQAKAALDYKMFYGKGRVIHYNEIQSNSMMNGQNLDIQLDALFEAMTNYDLVNVHDELNELYCLATQLRSKLTIQNFTVFLVMKLDSYLQQINEDLFQMLNLDIQGLDVIMKYETIDEIHSWLRYMVYELSELLQMKKHKKNWKLVQTIIDDVKLRLHENFTLKDVAEKYSFTPNYLGQIFKEETSTNFTDYVVMLRMEKASELLLHTKLKVYEIANLTGHRYLPYFSRQFKDHYGKTPLEYRRRL